MASTGGASGAGAISFDNVGLALGGKSMSPTSRSRCAPASSCAWSARRDRARRRCCGSRPACGRRPPAVSRQRRARHRAVADVAIVFQDYGARCCRGDGCRQRLARAEVDRNASAARPDRIRVLLQGRARRTRGEVPDPAFWRHAAARADRPLSRAGRLHSVDGRAVRRARCDDAAIAAGRGAGPRRRSGRDGAVRHPRSGRGALPRRPRGRALHQSRPRRPRRRITLPRPRNQLTTREHPKSCACAAISSSSWRKSTHDQRMDT